LASIWHDLLNLANVSCAKFLSGAMLVLWQRLVAFHFASQPDPVTTPTHGHPVALIRANWLRIRLVNGRFSATQARGCMAARHCMAVTAFMAKVMARGGRRITGIRS
jgi:hypothetical protein